MSKLTGLWQAVRHQFRFFLLVLLGYLCQVCIMPYVQLGDVTPSLLYVVIAIVTVGYGKLRALWAGGIYGIIMETMLPAGLSMLNLLMYPIGAVFVSIFFADKSEKKLEEERSIGRPLRRSHDLLSRLTALSDLVKGAPGQNANPYIRTPLCALVNVLIYEIINLMYMYLGGSQLTGLHYSRALINIIATTCLTILLMVPLRRFLGFRKPQPAEKASQVRG